MAKAVDVDLDVSPTKELLAFWTWAAQAAALRVFLFFTEQT